MTLEHKGMLLRTGLRNNAKSIIEGLDKKYISKDGEKQNIPDICMFCGSSENLTKEHVLSRWVFENSPNKFFTTDINGLNQTYIKTTIPACLVCNSDILNSLEKYVQASFKNRDVKKQPFTIEELESIILWLEIIDYKFQILNAQREFKASKSSGYIPYLADFPLSVLRKSVDYSPKKTITEIKRSQKRLLIKSKLNAINSLIVFRTTNKSFHFFHHMDDFIFLELPRQQIALFYFYKKKFTDKAIAFENAMKIINTLY
ncbi:hypothetical protein [Niabella beijingensis]|uniref:hypothetical protein n=1 Tax=Niabella beijingensis TaxID=2872700 RepID=UPI001CBC3A2B|nr:hypothetical protein [Niabella beijingensis]MBZ4191566.1 hypothetical protein [Niabella beijingensis]